MQMVNGSLRGGDPSSDRSIGNLRTTRRPEVGRGTVFRRSCLAYNDDEQLDAAEEVTYRAIDLFSKRAVSGGMPIQGRDEGVTRYFEAVLGTSTFNLFRLVRRVVLGSSQPGEAVNAFRRLSSRRYPPHPATPS